jgi:hypothetical protein
MRRAIQKPRGGDGAGQHHQSRDEKKEAGERIEAEAKRAEVGNRPKRKVGMGISQKRDDPHPNQDGGRNRANPSQCPALSFLGEYKCEEESQNEQKEEGTQRKQERVHGAASPFSIAGALLSEVAEGRRPTASSNP